MHKRKSVLENEPYKILCDFEIKMEQPISAKRPDLALVNKRTSYLVDFAENKRNKKNRQILGSCQGVDKTWNKVTLIPIVIGTLGIVHKGLEKRLQESVWFLCLMVYQLLWVT